MIRWNNGKKVFVKLSESLGGLVLQWIGSSSNTSQIKLIDKAGATYYVNKNNVTMLLPKDIDKKDMSHMMIIDPEDLYMEPMKKEEKKKIRYREKKYKTQRKREKAYNRK